MLWADSQRGNSLEDYRAPAPETETESLVEVSGLQRKESEPT